jgi:hypothetical protein
MHRQNPLFAEQRAAKIGFWERRRTCFAVAAEEIHMDVNFWIASRVKPVTLGSRPLA